MKRLLSVFLPILVVVGIFSQRQAVFDWYKLRGYTPSPQIASLATATTMTNDARHLFYVYHPELNDQATFNQHCNEYEASIVLGCYVQNQGIYLYDITDKRLDGVEEVTAAHEMLHAAYDRLSTRQQKRIDSLTQQAFESQANDRLKATVQAYRDQDPSVVPNELHSIIATEVRSIPKELEDYYKQYFSNRLAIVAFSEKYEQEFSQREKQAELYKQQLTNMKSQIDFQNSKLGEQANALSQEYEALQTERETTTDEAGFNIRVRAYNESVVIYNQAVGNVSALIDEYNSTIKKYNAVVIEEKELIKAIDSRPNTIQTE